MKYRVTRIDVSTVVTIDVEANSIKEAGDKARVDKGTRVKRERILERRIKSVKLLTK